jgi:hypothetical protein
LIHDRSFFDPRLFQEIDYRLFIRIASRRHHAASRWSGTPTMDFVTLYADPLPAARPLPRARRIALIGAASILPGALL